MMSQTTLQFAMLVWGTVLLFRGEQGGHAWLAGSMVIGALKGGAA